MITKNLHEISAAENPEMKSVKKPGVRFRTPCSKCIFPYITVQETEKNKHVQPVRC